MGFSRVVTPVVLEQDALTAAMIGIGMRFVGAAEADVNIEDTLFAASVQAMDRDDLRVLAVLVTWFGVHHPRVNADRMTKLAGAGSRRVRGLWSALAAWQARDRRFARLVEEGERLDLLATGTEFQIRRHGEDTRFVGTGLRVPANVLRDRERDVMAPSELACRHAAYRYRIIMGPSYRADLWAAIERNPRLTAAELARAAYGSFASAWQVKRDFELVRAGRRSPARRLSSSQPRR